MNDEFKTASDIARDPASVSAGTYIFMLSLAILGGVVRVIREAKFGDKSWKQILGMFLAEIVVSMFTGLLTYFLCAARGVDGFYSAALVSISAYMGGRALNVIESLYRAWIKDAKALDPDQKD